MKKLAGVALTLGLLFGSAVAQAQEFGSQGRAVFGAERLFGLSWAHHWQKSQNPAAPDPVNDTNGFSFLWQPNAAVVFNVPRVTFDYFVIDHLSVGGTIAYASWTDSRPNELPRPADRDNSAFMFMPRVGYAYMFGSVVGIWPHGGLSYHSYSTSVPGQSDKGSGFAFDIDCQFVFAITPHFGVTVGPSFDVDLTGSHTANPGAEQDEHFRQFGIQAGLLGWI